MPGANGKSCSKSRHCLINSTTATDMEALVMIKRYLILGLALAATTLALGACAASPAHNSAQAAPTPIPASSAPTTSLWEVVSEHRVAYITAETLKLTSKSYPLPNIINRAFAQSGSVYFEQNP